jgi:hypothetical protein
MARRLVSAVTRQVRLSRALDVALAVLVLSALS